MDVFVEVNAYLIEWLIGLINQLIIDVNFYCCIICNTVFVCISSLNSVICAIIPIYKQQTGWLVTWDVLVGCMSLRWVWGVFPGVQGSTQWRSAPNLSSWPAPVTQRLYTSLNWRITRRSTCAIMVHLPISIHFDHHVPKYFILGPFLSVFSISTYNFSSLPKVTEFIFKYEISWKTAL